MGLPYFSKMRFGRSTKTSTDQAGMLCLSTLIPISRTSAVKEMDRLQDGVFGLNVHNALQQYASITTLLMMRAGKSCMEKTTRRTLARWRSRNDEPMDGTNFPSGRSTNQESVANSY